MPGTPIYPSLSYPIILTYLYVVGINFKLVDNPLGQEQVLMVQPSPRPPFEVIFSRADSAWRW